MKCVIVVGLSFTLKSLITIGGIVPGLALQTDPLPPLKPVPRGRTLSRDQESPTSACPFPQTSSPTLPGISMPLLGGMIGADGLTAQGVSSQVIPFLKCLQSFNCFFFPLHSHSSFCAGNVKISHLFFFLNFMSGFHTRRSCKRCKPSPESLLQCQQRVFLR